MPNQKCPICENNAQVSGDFSRQTSAFVCDICGEGSITREAIERLDNRPQERWLLQAHLRRQPGLASKETLKAEDVTRILDTGSPYSPDEQLDLLLATLAGRTQALNEPAEFDIAVDFPLISARSPKEAAWLAMAQMNAGFLDNSPRMFYQPAASPTNNAADVRGLPRL